MSKQEQDIINGLKEVLNIPNMFVELISGTVTEIDRDGWTCTVQLDNETELYDVQLKAFAGTVKGCVEIPKLNTDVQLLQFADTGFMVIKVEEVEELIINTNERIIINVSDVKIEATKTDINATVGESKVNITGGNISLDVSDVKIATTKSDVNITLGKSIIKATKSDVDIAVGESKVNVSENQININKGTLGGLPIASVIMDNLTSIKNRIDALEGIIPGALDAIGTGTSASGNLGKQAFDAALLTVDDIELEGIENEKVKH